MDGHSTWATGSGTSPLANSPVRVHQAAHMVGRRVAAMQDPHMAVAAMERSRSGLNRPHVRRGHDRLVALLHVARSSWGPRLLYCLHTDLFTVPRFDLRVWLATAGA